MSRSGTRDGSNDDPTLLQQFHAVIKKWEEGRTDTAHYDPTETMREMANILEKVRHSSLIFKSQLRIWSFQTLILSRFSGQ